MRPLGRHGHALEGQDDAERAAAPLLARHVDASAVVVDDLRADEQPEPGAALRILRGDERVEDALELGGGDAAARVGDLHLYLVAARARGHADGAAGRRRVERVGEEVQHDLLQLAALREQPRHPGVGLDGQLQPRRRHRRPHQLHRLLHEAVDVHRHRRLRRAPREVEEPVDDLAQPSELALDHAQAALDRLRHGQRRQILAQQLQMAHHRMQRRSNLVGDLGHDAARERQPLGVAEVTLHREEPLAGARDHVVEAARQRAELVVRRDGHGLRLGAAHGAHEPLDRPVDHAVDGEGHEQTHHEHGDRREPEGDRAAARLARVEAVEREARGDRAGHRAVEPDRRHHLPRAAARVGEQA